MNYLQSLTYLESLAPGTQKPCLERLAAFMQEAGNLQDGYQSIHVGGTNGKGSTVALLDSVLRQSDLTIGRYTGPHLLRWNERFHIGGRPISDLEFAHLCTRLRRLSEDFAAGYRQFGQLTWFELLTAMSFFYFAENNVDLAVFEVGLGGRWDATNVLNHPLVSVITNVDLDHTQILGETVVEIAREKSGIIKPGVPVVTAATGSALHEISRTARKLQSDLYHVSDQETITFHAADGGAAAVYLHEPEQLQRARAELSLLGSHQQLNARVTAATLMAAHYVRPTLKTIQATAGKGFKHVYWPGRMQYINSRRLLLDGAHNPAGAAALRQALDETFPQQAFNFVLACFENKDAAGVIDALIRPADRVWVAAAATRRAVYSTEALSQIARKHTEAVNICSSVFQALTLAMQERQPGDLIVATGSLAVVREVMLALGWNCVEDGLPESTTNSALNRSLLSV